jgi:BASS family bile acid:Na+ symporter
MQSSVFSAVLLPLGLAIIMLGLGLSLTWADFRRVAQMPRPVLVGLVVQTLVLPAAALGIAHVFGLGPALAVGLVLLAASPGGATANLFSHLAEGDVALNITLTAVNSLLSIVTLPVLLGLALAHFMGQERHIPLQFGKIVSVMAIVLVPVALGMLVRRRKPDLAHRLDKPVRLASATFLALIIAATAFQERAHLGDLFAQVGLPALVFNLVSLGVGFLVPRILRLPERQATAIALEIGIHNGTLAIAIAHTVLQDGTMAVPAAIYSLIMFATAGAFSAWARKRIRAEQPPARSDAQALDRAA